MKNTELRVGNLIQYNEGDVCKVVGIHKFGIDVEFPEEFTYMEYDQFSPIPLTEEWLLNFGFAKGFNTLFKQINSFGRQVTVSIEFNGMDDIAIWTTENDGTEDETNSTFNIESNLKHVHQLQNLHFALLGEELNLI